jgi:hypothetical protein
LLTVFDLDKHEPIAFLQLPDGVDVIKFDPGLRRIYAACYSGAISVIHQDDPNHYRKIEDFKVQHAVHTVAVTSRRIVYIRQSRKRMGNPWPVWLCMTRYLTLNLLAFLYQTNLAVRLKSEGYQAR